MDLTVKLATLRDMKAEVAPILAEIKRLEQEIKEEILETGEMPDVYGVKVRVQRGYTRKQWDGKALQEYARHHPEIMAFCTEKQTRDYVALSFQKENSS